MKQYYLFNTINSGFFSMKDNKCFWGVWDINYNFSITTRGLFYLRCKLYDTDTQHSFIDTTILNNVFNFVLPDHWDHILIAPRIVTPKKEPFANFSRAFKL